MASFPVADFLEAMRPETRAILIANPNNPTGQLIPREALREIARCAPPDVTIVVDEAYHDFCGETFLPELDAHPNVLIGRTFAKAHGLAGRSAGLLELASRYTHIHGAACCIGSVVDSYLICRLRAVGRSQLSEERNMNPDRLAARFSVKRPIPALRAGTPLP